MNTFKLLVAASVGALLAAGLLACTKPPQVAPLPVVAEAPPALAPVPEVPAPAVHGAEECSKPHTEDAPKPCEKAAHIVSCEECKGLLLQAGAIAVRQYHAPPPQGDGPPAPDSTKSNNQQGD